NGYKGQGLVLAQYDINLREYWRILKKRKLIVITFGVILGFLTTVLAIIRAPEPIYTTSTLIEIEQAPALEGIYSTNSTSDSDDIDTQMTVIKSYAVFQRVAEKMGLIPHGAVREDEQLTENVIPIIESLQDRVDVTREGWSSILKISATDKDPETAKELANTVALTYKEVHGEDQLKLTKKRLQHIGEQLADARKRLRESEDEFNRFSQENELISIDLQSEGILVRRQQIQDELRVAQKDREELESLCLRLNRFTEDTSGSDQDFFSPTTNTQYQSAHGELVELLLTRDTLLKDFTPKHPDVTALSNQVSEKAQKMVILLESQIAGIEKEELDLEKELQRVDSKGKILMEKKLEYDRLKRQVDREDEMTALLETEQQEALIRRSESPEEVKIVRPALLPLFPTNSPRLVTTGGTGIILGLFLGMVIGFIVETFDTSLGAIEDVEETLGTKVLGIIPQTDARDIRISFREKHPDDGLMETMENQSIYLVSHFMPQSMVAESFRALRTSVIFNNAENRMKSIAIASTSPKEGKTVVAVNLALTMAQSGMKILLVGSDLRKPTVDRVFGVGLTPGLTDVLMGNLPWRETIKTVMDMVMGKMSQTQVMTTPGLDNVHIITSGPKPPNPAELLESKALNDFLEEAKEEYDMIIFDSPPILSTADAAILSAKVDGVLLVYRVGIVSRGLLKRATAQLEQVKCNIMGVILNGMRPEVSSDFQDLKSYNYYYAYGSDEQGSNSRPHGKFWSFLKEKTNSGKKAILQKKQNVAQLKPLTKKSHKGLRGLILLAICSLVGGVLFQSGLIDPFSKPEDEGPVTEYRIKAIVKKEIPRMTGENESTAVSSKPKAERDAKTSVNVSPKVETPPVELKPSVAEVSTEIGPSSLSFDNQPDDLVDVKMISYPFSLQLGAFRDLKEAQKLILTCKEKGLSAYWSEVELASGIWYRVFVGHFEDRESAESFKKEHGLQGAGVKDSKYANLIGIYSSSSELEDKILSLRNLGYSPYVIKDSETDFRLMVGNHVTQEGAEELYDNLKADGIVNQIIER
ncbi:MAG: polysaccharide biosynthesis tyrosine autokinase, partial [Deltaproteobacteria bacterium]|nr:polysaccharide biosynthesis tyrosine autokinase [Deltaproteobacteria bacterium]